MCAEEFVVLHRRFLEAGHNVQLATPGGRRASFDPNSLDDEAAAMDVAEMKEHLRIHTDALDSPRALHDIDPDALDLIAIPGGYGPLQDLHQDRDLGRILERVEARGRFIAAVCHGAAGFLSAQGADGRWLFAGRKMTAFSDEEEYEFGVADHGPWLLASRLRERGALYQRGPKWKPFVLRDRNLFTGQNPASTDPLADLVLAALRAS